MNAISRMPYANDYDGSVHNASDASQLMIGLGPNQLTWLRRNINSFKHAEEQRRLLRQDVVRAARMAGLI